MKKDDEYILKRFQEYMMQRLNRLKNNISYVLKNKDDSHVASQMEIGMREEQEGIEKLMKLFYEEGVKGKGALFFVQEEINHCRQHLASMEGQGEDKVPWNTPQNIMNARSNLDLMERVYQLIEKKIELNK